MGCYVKSGRKSGSGRLGVTLRIQSRSADADTLRSLSRPFDFR